MVVFFYFFRRLNVQLMRLYQDWKINARIIFDFFELFFCPDICSGFVRLYQDWKINAILFLDFFYLKFSGAVVAKFMHAWLAGRTAALQFGIRNRGPEVFFLEKRPFGATWHFVRLAAARRTRPGEPPYMETNVPMDFRYGTRDSPIAPYRN